MNKLWMLLLMAALPAAAVAEPAAADAEVAAAAASVAASSAESDASEATESRSSQSSGKLTRCPSLSRCRTPGVVSFGSAV